jgi:CubicO group peptidase (beta-lactamase class C family)
VEKLANCLAAMLMLTAALAQAQAPSQDRYGAAVVAGHVALFNCSARFNGGQSDAQIERDIFSPVGRQLPESPEVEIDVDQRKVRVAFAPDMPPRIAAWRPVLGCTQLPIGATADRIETLPHVADDVRVPDLDAEAWPMGDREATAALPRKQRAALDALVDKAFDGATYGGTTWAVVVIKDGKIVAERYALGYDMHTSARTHSAIKSIASTVVGVAVEQGLLEIDQAPAVEEWSAPADPRGQITIENLLHMASGLDARWSGPGEDFYFGGAAAAGRITHNLLTSVPGTRFAYAGSDTVLALRAVRQAIDDDARFWAFPYRELLWKAGMTRTVVETDWNGDFLMSGQAWSTARDFARFGLLYLNDGVVSGERILPEGWADYVATAAPAQPAGSGPRYGAQFWLYGGLAGLPGDAFSPSGAEGQYAMIVPSENLVVVRRGFDRSGGFDIVQFSADVIDALWTPEVPVTWDEEALEDWATPLAGLGAQPTHMSAEDYYAIPVENLRAYPVYMPELEPEGYWEELNRLEPEPLFESDGLETKGDWVEAGKRVFMDWAVLRTLDTGVIAMARDQATMGRRAGALPDGTINGLRWVPTKDGVALGFTNCSACHVLYLPDDTPVPGASSFAMPNSFRNGVGGDIREAERTLPGETPFQFAGTIGSWAYQSYGTPWVDDPAGEALKDMTEEEYNAWIGAGIAGGSVARWNGSILYPAKIPDLIGFRDRKFIDHTATHVHRNIGDLMRYGALVSSAEAIEFAGRVMTAPGTTRFPSRLPDDALYALALYVYSLEPPENPNPFDDNARAGQRIFEREGCSRCHTPPLYTNNRITLAEGFEAPAGAPAELIRRSVGTDPGLALQTRKGTGYYKVPSLKGLWYRGHYLHDGAAASLEEMFDPERLENTHRRGGFSPPGVETLAIQGHEFGLELTLEEREQLIAFLRTL